MEAFLAHSLTLCWSSGRESVSTQCKYYLLRIRIPEANPKKIPVWRIRDTVPFWPLDPGSGWVKNQDPDPGAGSWMNNPDHISESLETLFWVKISKFFDADPGRKKFGKNSEKILTWSLEAQLFFSWRAREGQESPQNPPLPPPPPLPVGDPVPGFAWAAVWRSGRGAPAGAVEVDGRAAAPPLLQPFLSFSSSCADALAGRLPDERKFFFNHSLVTEREKTCTAAFWNS